LCSLLGSNYFREWRPVVTPNGRGALGRLTRVHVLRRDIILAVYLLYHDIHVVKTSSKANATFYHESFFV
jgi:hypothetical protein